MHGFKDSLYFVHEFAVQELFYIFCALDTFTIPKFIGLFVEAGFEFHGYAVIVFENGDFQVWMVNLADDAHEGKAFDEMTGWRG